MPLISSALFLAFLSGVFVTNVINYGPTIVDVMYNHIDLKPVNRTVLQHYTTAHTNTITEKYIAQTVKDIYTAALRDAALRKDAYEHPFMPLLPIHVYPSTTYLPVILEKLESLFPDCTVSMNDRVGKFVITWL
jgi:hypothetical protein